MTPLILFDTFNNTIRIRYSVLTSLLFWIQTNAESKRIQKYQHFSKTLCTGIGRCYMLFVCLLSTISWQCRASVSYPAEVGSLALNELALLVRGVQLTHVDAGGGTLVLLHLVLVLEEAQIPISRWPTQYRVIEINVALTKWIYVTKKTRPVTRYHMIDITVMLSRTVFPGPDLSIYLMGLNPKTY